MSEYRQDEHTTAKEASKTHTDQSYRHNSWEEHEKRRYSFKEQAIKSMTLFFVVATCILFYFALLRLGQISSVFKQFLTVAKPIIYGLAIAYLLNPIVKWIDRRMIPLLEKHCPKLKKKKQISRGVGIFVSVILMLALITTLLNMMIPELYGSIRDMIFTVPSQMNRFINEFSKMHSSDSTVGKMLASIVEEASDFVQNWMKTDLMEKVNLWMTQLTVGMIQMIREVFNFIIGIIVSIYVLFSKEKFQKQTKKLIYAVFRPGQANMILQIGGKSNEIFGGFIIGKIIDSLIIGVICFIGLSILNMPYTMLVSVIVGVTNVIPFFGPYIGAIPSAILILLADPLKGLYFIIFVIALQQFDGNVLGPKILGNSTGLSSFWVVFSILIAGGLFGIPGMLFGVPTFAVIYYIVNMLVNSILKKKELPTDTECYGKNGYVDSEGIYIQKEKQEEIKEIQEEKGDKPIRVQNDLPVKEILEQENIFVMDEMRAAHQDIRPISIGLLNLMPLKEDTELQILRALSNSPLQVDVTFVRVTSHVSKNTSTSHIYKFYEAFDDIKGKKFDGFIITGAPVEQMPFEDVDYWEELKRIMEWTKTNVVSTLHLCWGAQAGIYYHYGIDKVQLPEKRSGLFWHHVRNRKIPIVRGFDDKFLAPHSRHTEVPQDLLEKDDRITILADSEEAGVYLCMAQDGRQIFVMGHPEYDRMTLDSEYKRDLGKGLNPQIPENYYPNDDPEKKPMLTWRAHCNNLYTNWLNYYVYQVTPYDLYGTPF